MRASINPTAVSRLLNTGHVSVHHNVPCVRKDEKAVQKGGKIINKCPLSSRRGNNFEILCQNFVSLLVREAPKGVVVDLMKGAGWLTT